jgi:serine/threonine protein kinase
LPRYVTHFEEAGSLFLALERVEGSTLAELRGRLSEADVHRFLADASDVLDYLHGRAPPIVHRDVKPSNVIRRPDGRFVLVDFGSVQHRLRPEGGSTVVGTFGYMAPEQFQGRAMPATDVYAVAATALSVLTGTDPEALPHKGLALDVPAALGRKRSDPLCGLLSAALDPDPDVRSRFTLRALLARYPLGADSRRKKSQQRPRAQQSEWRRRRSRPPFHSSGARNWLHFAPALLAVLWGLRVARVATSAALLLIVPVVLTLLSIVFGSELRRGAERVRAAGRRASATLKRVAQRALRASRAPSAPPGSNRVRLDTDRESWTVESFEQDVENFEDEADRAARQVEETLSRRR